MDKNIAKNKKIQKFDYKFLLLQIFLLTILIGLIVLIALDSNIVKTIDNFVFKLCDHIRCLFLNNLMLIITFLGDTLTILILLVTSIFILKKQSLFLIIPTSISVLINLGLKNIVQRARPVGEFVNHLIFNINFPQDFSFPSGHAQTSLVFYFILIYLFLDNFYKGKLKKLILSFSLILPILIMISRLILGVHFFSDILGGVMVAVIIITNFIYFYKRFKQKTL